MSIPGQGTHGDLNGQENASQEDSVIIAVMGPTGSGKSSFVRTASGRQDVEIGHGLTSATEQVKAYHFTVDGVAFTLVDTPGFDDTYRDDAVILQEISNYLDSSFNAGARIRAIFYMHNVTKTRLEGSALDNLYLFRSLCGPDCLQNVVLGLTFGETLSDQNLFAQREQELRNTPEFWGKMIDRGSQVERIPTTEREARDLLLRCAKKAEITLLVQEELSSGIKLEETSAGSTVRGLKELVALREKSDADIAAYKESVRQEIEKRNLVRKEKQAKDEADFQARLQLERTESEAVRIAQEEVFRRAEEGRKRDMQELKLENERIEKQQKLLTEQLKQMQLEIDAKAKKQAHDRLKEAEKARYLANTAHERQQSALLSASFRSVKIKMADDFYPRTWCDRCGSPPSTKLYYKCYNCTLAEGLDEVILCERCYDQGLRCYDEEHKFLARHSMVGTDVAKCKRKRLPASPKYRVPCDLCGKLVQSIYFHCCACKADNFDICLSCVISGKTCLNTSHTLHKLNTVM